MSKEYIRNWFSNMELFDSPLIADGIAYNSVENYYQAMKLFPEDFEGRKYIASLSPRKSKTEIRKMKVRELSPAQKIEIMNFALNHKFNHHTSWGKRLLENKDEVLVEYNNWGDVFWGYDVEKNEGKNYLGLLLTARRSELLLEKMLFEARDEVSFTCKA